MAWWDFFKVFTYAFTDGPLAQRNRKEMGGAGHSQPDAIPDIRAGQDGTWGGGRGSIRLRDTNDFVDLSTVTNRIHRYKEYERLRNMAEIEMAMTVFADEACFAGDTKVATPHGFRTLKELVEETERFLVYCYDFEKQDFTLGWAFDARKTKTASTVKVLLDDGHHFVCTPDHRILLRDGSWLPAGELQQGCELMPFYRLPARFDLTQLKTNQFPRIWTHTKGWVHERQFVDEWVNGKTREDLKLVNHYCQMIAEGLTVRQMYKLTGSDFRTIRERVERAGFSNKELKWLGTREDRRRVIGVQPWKEIDVYDLAVEKHHNFCTDWGVAHNCQRDDDGKVFKINCANQEVQEELEFLWFHRKMLNFDQKKCWDMAKRLFINGDYFYEIIIDPENPKGGIIGLNPLPPDSMYRIETTKGKLVEFQQSKEGPDYQSLARVEITQATEADLQQATAIRFAPEQIVHIRIGDDRKTFYPYGVSLIEAARGPAHQLRLMEDAMVVYRLCLVGDSRIRTDNGWKYIKNIQKNDVVYSLYNNEIVPTKVVAHLNNGLQPVYSVRSKHVELIGNDKHPVLVLRNGKLKYVEIKDLVPKQDQIINLQNDVEISKRISTIYGEKWAKLSSDQRCAFRNTSYENRSELMRQCTANADRVKQFLYAEDKALPYEQAVEICEVFSLNPDQLTITNKGQINSEKINLPEFVDEEFARLFGFLLGDGSIRSNNFQLSFAAGLDEDVNRYHANLLKKYFGKIRFEPEKRKRLHPTGNYVVNSQAACKIMIDLGYIHGAKNKRIPSWVFSAPKNIRKSFILGLSEADGCERHTDAGTWFSTIELCNKRLVEDVKEIWHSIGLCSGHIKTRTRDGGHEIEEDRKMCPSTSYSVTISEKELPEYENIVSVEYVGEENVYDLTVEHEAHNFVVNGTCTSNTRAPERRVFYIDVQQLPPMKAEAFIERMKDQFKKKKMPSRGHAPGASSVEERWHAPAADEDYWIPIRPNANTRVETLPGAQNLGEIDDTVYFRNKLFTALNFPRNYFNNEDTQSTRIALSAQDIKFARMIERLQSHVEDALWEISDRHLRLLGYPEEVYEDLEIKMTPPSDWRELTRAEVVTNRLNNAANLKGSQLLSDYDILTLWLKYPEEEAREMLARLKIQKLEDLKLQIVAQNPTLLGVGLPGPDEPEIGTEPGGPNAMLTPGGEEPQQPLQGMRKYMDADDEQYPMGGAGAPVPQGPPPKAGSGSVLPDPSDDDIVRYDLEIKDFAREMDDEEVDRSEEY